MLEPVPAWVLGGIAKPKRRREVDDAADVPGQLRHDAEGGFVGKSEEHGVEPCGADLVEVEGAELEVRKGHGERRSELRRQHADVRVGGGDRQLQVGMGGDQPEQLDTGVPRCTDDTDPSHGA